MVAAWGQALCTCLWDTAVPQAAHSVAQVRAADDFLGQMHCPSKSCLRLTWAHRSSEQPQDSSEKTVANANLRRTLTSAPPVMRQSRDKDPGRPVPLQVGASAEPSHHPHSPDP